MMGNGLLALGGTSISWRADRQHTDSHSLRLNHHDNATFKHRHDLSQIRQQEFHLALRSLGRCTAKQNHRWQRRIAQREDCAEIGIGRYNHPLLSFSEVKNQAVIGIRQAMIPDMSCIMLCSTQPFREDGGKRVVDQESHNACSRDSSRSRTASAA